jgi:hypothetical protein
MLRLRHQLLLFALSWITFAWFHQGGGWNQNARFAEVRALVEEGTFAIDDFLVYRPGEGDVLVREKVVNGEFVRGGKTCRLCWSGGGAVIPVNGRAPGDGAEVAVVGTETCSGDVGYSPDGHFHPNKPPGMSLLAVPVYFAAWHVERALGLNPDDWRVMNGNLWLCSVFTVGLASALGVVLFARVALAMFPGRVRASVAAAIVLGFGTTFFPFGTLLFDHNTTAVLLLAAFSSVRGGQPFRAGIFAGAAAVVNYLAAIPGIFFGVWALARSRRGSDAMKYLAGVLPCFVGLLAYNAAAFGSALTLNTSFQNPAFKEVEPAFLGMFTAPSWFATVCLTVSPWRGLFVLSPVLVLSLVGFWQWWRGGALAAERRIAIAVAAFFFLVNICFNGFHGGFSAGPRYLVPALPFLCLPLVPVFAQWRFIAGLLAAVSIVQQVLLTATDALNPLGMGEHAWRDQPDEWKEKMHGNSLVWRYAWPLFAEGRAWPPLRDEWEEWLEKHPALSAEERDAAWQKVQRGEKEPLLLAAIPGPVSVNPMGPWDGTYFALFSPHSRPADAASCNAGEWLWPGSRTSLVPLVVLWGVGVWIWRRARVFRKVRP